MQEAVSEVLATRTHDLDGMSRMVGVSVAAHVGILALLFAAALLWPAGRKPPVVVMTISLGGTPGPKVPGIASASARPVEQPVPTPKRPEPTPVATSKPPAAVAQPTKAVAKPAEPTPKPAPAKPAPDPLRYYTLNNAPTSNKPVTGPQRQAGTAQAETGVKGVGTGLASGGAGVKLELDSGFCCPEYIDDIVNRIRANWKDVPDRGTNVIRFTIERDGRIDVNSISIFQSSGRPDLDALTLRALKLTGQVGPLPTRFTGPRLTMRLTVEYGGS